jgi:glycosyltransferase involved in cell wall biosynthesis
MSDKIPQFSIVIPTYNRRAVLDLALRTVLSQTCRDFEVIVVDDGSNDGTAEWIATTYGQFQVIRQPNGGPGSARNRGIISSRGSYIVLFDSDDEWFPWTLATYQEAIRRFDNPSVILGQWVDDGPQSDHVWGASGCEPEFVDYPDFLAASERPVFWSSNNVAIRRDLLCGENLFEESLRVFEDKDLGIRLGVEKGFVKIDRPGTVIYRRTPGSLSVNLTEALKGIRHVVSREIQGGYPGGFARRRQRRNYICLTSRSVSLALLKDGRFKQAWSLFFSTLAWNISLGRARYLFGFPTVGCLALLRKLLPS